MLKQNKGPSTSSFSGRDEEGEEEEMYNVGILEQLIKDLVNEYRITSCYDEDDRTKIVMYRMNCEKKNSEETYEGRVDFRVGVGGVMNVMSRNRSGVYDHLCDNERVSTPHCRIQGPRYPDDFIWIQDLQISLIKHGTFVNGKMVQSGGKCRVLCGDVIGLGAPYDTMDQWGDPNDDNRGFVFTVKNFGICGSDSEELSPEPGPNHQNHIPAYLALNNVVVVDTIMKFLKVKDLKSARLVNRFWKNRADPRLFGSSFVSFSHISGTRGEYLEEDWGASFPGKVSMIEEYSLGNWELKMNEFFKRKKVYPPVKADVQWLVQNMGHYARNLELQSDYWPHPWGSNIANMMSHFRNLDKLKISCKFPIPLTEDFFSAPAPTTFPSVTQLNLCIGFTLDPNVGPMPVPNVSSISQMFPNIRKFEASSHQFHLMIEYIHENPQVWPNLKEVAGTCDFEPSEDQRTIRMISSLPHKLTKIEFGFIRVSIDFGDTLELMMNNHSETLEHLHLSFDLDVWSKQDRYILRFPSFPRLKVLQLRVTHNDATPNRLGFEIMFPSGGSVCYTKDLPQIQKLEVNFHLYCAYEGKVPLHISMKEIMDVFLPKDEQTVSRTMKWVDFGLFEIKIREIIEAALDLDSNPWYKEFLERFIKVFPYVHDPHVIKGLKLLNVQKD